jgi:hypothetical protein
MECIIEPISPPSSPVYEITQISPPSSPIVKTLTIIKEQTVEFTPEWFNISNKEWRKNKIYSQKKQLFYYKTNTDSPFTLEDYKSKSKKNINKAMVHPNSMNWANCGYISANGDICTQQGIFSDNENNSEFDYEKYTDIHLCEQHSKFMKKETRKRYLTIECALLERQLKLTTKLDKLKTLEK